jgi:hypothetical protein
MSTSIDVELILATIDEACRDWQQKFKTTTDEFMQAIGELFYNCTQALIQLSIITDDDNAQGQQNRLNAERIVSKLKQLNDSLGDLWPSNIDSFGRDTFDIGPYHIEAAEFFHPVPFYPDSNFLMKLYRWSVYNAEETVVYRYYLEHSEIIPGQPYYVLGKSDANGHSQIQPYGGTIPDYNQMKKHVINNSNDQGPSPIISMKIL